MKTRLLLCLIIALLSTLVSKNALATTYTWAGGASGAWTTNSNWSPSTGYPGSCTCDIAVINTSNANVTLSSSVTIAQLKTTSFGVTGVTVTFSGSPTLTISSGLSLAQPSSASNVLTFSGNGAASISGTSSFSFVASMKVSAGITCTFNSGAVIDFNSNQGTFTNDGQLNLNSCTFKLGFAGTLSNSGRVDATGTTFTMSGSPSHLSNTNIFNATSCTFTASGSSITITNSSAGVMTMYNSSFTMSNSSSSFINSGTYRDHNSTISLTGQSDVITNSGSSSFMSLRGTDLSFSSGNNAHSISNAGTLSADSATTIGLGTQNCQLSNTGTVYAGTSNSDCAITLSGQGSNITNSGTMYLGSTSVINPSGTSAQIKNNASGFFILQSDIYGSATISKLSSTASYSGNFIIERYLQGGAGYRSYRMLSSPVYTATVSSVNVYSINYLKNYIYLTGTTTTGGFDNTVAANPTLYLYRENLTPGFNTYLNSNFVGINKINNATSYAYSMNDATYTSTYNIPVGSGFLCFFRGDRSTSFAYKTSMPFPTPENATVISQGTMNAGTISSRNWFNPGTTTLSYTAGTPVGYKGCNLMGNPYPSTIDWETYQSTNTGVGIYGKNISSTVYLLNPQTQNFDTYQKGGSFTNNGTRYIVSGQAFFVVASGSSSAVTFYETAKVYHQNTGANLFMGTPADLNVNNQSLRLQLALDTINKDDILVKFNKGATAAYSPDKDAPYRQGFGKVSLASLSTDHVPLAISERTLPVSSDTIQISVNTSADGLYALNMKSIVGIPQLYDIWLMDAYRKDSLDMRHNSTYGFNVIKADTNSYGTHRFSLVIRQNPAYAYRLLSFTAAKVSSPAAKQVKVSWTSENEQNYTNFTVERSIDTGKTYEVLGGVPASGIGSYALVDKSPADHNLYRLKSEDINNKITYSNIAPIAYSAQSNSLVQNNINLYPNPTKSTINLNIEAAMGLATSYNIMITSSAGLLVRQVTSTQQNWQGNVSELMPGTYIVKVFSNKDQVLIGNGKFVKM